MTCATLDNLQWDMSLFAIQLLKASELMILACKIAFIDMLPPEYVSQLIYVMSAIYPSTIERGQDTGL